MEERAVGIVVALFILLSGYDRAFADELLLPKSIEGTTSFAAVYRFGTSLTGRGVLSAEWTDAAARLIERRNVRFDLAEAREVRLSFDGRRAVTVKNTLTVRVSLDRIDSGKTQNNREYESVASFVVAPIRRGWWDYQVMMWQRQTSAAYATLKQLGVSGAMVMSDRREEPGGGVMEQIDTTLDADLQWYLENIATDFYSAYHRWFADRPVNWRFLDVKRRYSVNPLDASAFIREPSLSDPQWLATLTRRLIGNVTALRRYRPLFYNLGDEPGIADLSAFWDFDLSDQSLAAMREWLKTRYGELAGLNDQWQTSFRSWDAVMPMTTSQALSSVDQNFAAWADFKEWMDISFARALRAGTDAVHAGDPEALSAIEGGQISGWGGYDYSRLSTSVDVIELSDAGESDEILRSFNPNVVMLTTSFGHGSAEDHRVWRTLLRGSRGLILWDEANEFVSKEGILGERGHEAAPILREIRGGVGALLINSRRHEDPIGIVYSPSSMRIEWLLDRIRSGEDWVRRDAGREWEDNTNRVSIRNYARALKRMGLQHRYISEEQLENGYLGQSNYRVLILPRTIAMSAQTASQITEFIKKGGTVIADGEPANFDGHGRKRQTPALAELFRGPASGTVTQFSFGKGQAIYLSAPELPGGANAQRLRSILAGVGIVPMFSLMRGDGQTTSDVETYIFQNGSTIILALLHDPNTVPGTTRYATSSPEKIKIKLPRPYNIYDIRAQRRLGLSAELKVELGATSPCVLALSQRPVSAPSISGPPSIRIGTTAHFRISSDKTGSSARAIFHMAVTDPGGKLVPHYSTNLLAPAGTGSFTLPLAINDKVGLWQVSVRNLLTGATGTSRIRVQPR